MTPITEIPYKENELLSAHTTFRVGGPAKKLYLPETGEQLIALKKHFSETSVPALVVGNGSNLLFSDAGFDGCIIKLENNYSNIEINDTRIVAQAGAKLSRLAACARDENLTGMEFAAGIPGTVGGAVCMNAGAYGGEMKDIVEWVNVIEEDGTERKYSNAELDFAYRHSAIGAGQIVESVCLKLFPGKREEIAARMDELKEKRKEKQPLEYPSAGSTFKRPEGYFAGKLIEDSGLKGYRVGGAMVSEKHAGFVINYDHATAQDICTLIKDVQRIVKEKQGVELTPEVKIIV